MRHLAAAIVAALNVMTLGCGPRVLTPHLHAVAEASRLPAGTPELKVHMRSGELYVLESWTMSSDGRVLDGNGAQYSSRRDPTGSGAFSLPVEEVALLETNDTETANALGLVGLGALTTFWGTISAVCVSDPKSCFGSCPTFYLDGDPERPRAEGFSSSVARVLEARDLDALPGARPQGGRLSLWMRNEALETHAVRQVRLLAVPRPEGSRVFASEDGRFRQASRLRTPLSCVGPEGDCLAALAQEDERERSSQTDPDDLAAREEIELRFPGSAAPMGLVVAARESLVSTFLFYQTLAYMGRSAGDWLARLERGSAADARRLMGLERALGALDIAVASEDGEWHMVGSFSEAGPIAGDTRLLPLEVPPGPGPIRVRLTGAKGRWRIGWVALAELGPPLAAREVAPSLVERDGRADVHALELLREGRSHLFTQPGDAYRLTFEVPEEHAELFLESEGYYYEWMRREWLADEDPTMVALILARPEEALRRLARGFKEREAAAEQAFWQSRFGR